MRSGRFGIGEGLGQLLGPTRHAGQPLDKHPVRRPPVERMRVVPALDERAEQVAHDRPAQLEGGIVPWRAVAILGIHRRRLRVTAVVGVVAPAVAQVDPTDECDVTLRCPAVPDDEQFLMMRGEPRQPLVEQNLAAGFVDLGPQPLVLLPAEPQVIGVRPPQQPADLDPRAGDLAQKIADCRAVRQQQLIGVAAPVGEVHPIAEA